MHLCKIGEHRPWGRSMYNVLKRSMPGGRDLNLVFNFTSRWRRTGYPRQLRMTTSALSNVIFNHMTPTQNQERPTSKPRISNCSLASPHYVPSLCPAVVAASCTKWRCCRVTALAIQAQLFRFFFAWSGKRRTQTHQVHKVEYIR